MAEGKEIEKLYRHFYRPMCLYATHYLGKVPIVEDVVQDAFLSLLGKLDSGKMINNPLGYLWTSVRNSCIDYFRRESNQKKEAISETMSEDDAIFESALAEANLWDAIDALPEGRRRMLLMHRRDGLKYSKIAELLGVSEGTVKNQISRGMRTLRNSAKK